ncbi:hypothetical protein SAMN04488516_11744 [Desulfonauticus submarinus]|uniref:Uncharacterized protein n=1 Tax=Desulfonauticus submarinus TaxID=206665 RepID=A0A1H0GCI2_9BACT|nr:hypothetical protein [Desulfonauticus submarinus]SDO04586.1 hypothetical protein SAMN04488516_11744 [Desulfonauticus submarinus]
MTVVLFKSKLKIKDKYIFTSIGESLKSFSSELSLGVSKEKYINLRIGKKYIHHTICLSLSLNFLKKIKTTFPYYIEVNKETKLADCLLEKFFKKNTIENKNFIKQKIVNTIQFSTYKEIQKINSIESTFFYKENIKIFLDDIEITNIVKEGKITLFDQNYILSNIEITLLKPVNSKGKIIKIFLDGLEFSFLIEEIKINKNLITIWGRTELAKYFKPFAKKNLFCFKNLLASQLASKVAKVNFLIDDFFIPFFQQETYPLEVLKFIASVAGGQVRCSKNNFEIYYPYKKKTPIKIVNILSIAYNESFDKIDTIQIIDDNKMNETIVIEANKTEVKPNEFITIKIYCFNKYKIKCNTDVCILKEKGTLEEIEEDVVCENGEGTISKPILNIVSISETKKIKINGQKILTDECKIVRVKYITKYDKWVVTNYKEAKKLFCCVQTDSSFIYKKGNTGIIKRVNTCIFNKYLAKQIAEKEFAEQKPFLNITVPFSREYCQPQTVETPYGLGQIVGSEIIFTSNPLTIYNNLKVLLCHQ